MVEVNQKEKSMLRSSCWGFLYHHPRPCLSILERGEWKEREKERNINQLPSCTQPSRVPNPQPAHVP